MPGWAGATPVCLVTAPACEPCAAAVITADAQVVYLETGQQMCLALEDRTSCKDQTREGAVVCAWRNAMLQPCRSPSEAAGDALCHTSTLAPSAAHMDWSS